MTTANFHSSYMPNNIKLNDFVRTLNSNTWKNLLNQRKKGVTTVIMPKFESAFEVELNEVLGKMGLDIAFDPNRANFTRMGSGGLFIDKVKHKTYLKVDEAGTEASAVTSIGINSERLNINFEFNKPFIFAIVDTDTELPIFIGTMENPTK